VAFRCVRDLVGSNRFLVVFGVRSVWSTEQRDLALARVSIASRTTSQRAQNQEDEAMLSEEWVGSGVSGSVVDRFDLEGRTALVTGGSRGIGKALAVGLAEAGADVGILSRQSRAEGEAVADLAKALGRKHSFAVLADVTSRAALDDAVAEAMKRWGHVDIMVANAGIGIDVKAEDMTEEQWDQLMNVNLKGVFLTAQAAARVMIPQKRGNIIVVSSLSAFVANGNPQACYNASKAGVNMLVRCLAYEWARFSIRVNAIAPGFIMSDLLVPYLTEFPDDAYGYMVAPAAMNRIGSPDELAGAAVFLASDASSYMTGQVMIIDGGYSLTPLENRLRP
jgi:NAD(P)-dependent dehydrogenase (short-subunit alcohol dehydrogenase family)